MQVHGDQKLRVAINNSSLGQISILIGDLEWLVSDTVAFHVDGVSIAQLPPNTA